MDREGFTANTYGTGVLLAISSEVNDCVTGWSGYICVRRLSVITFTCVGKSECMCLRRRVWVVKGK